MFYGISEYALKFTATCVPFEFVNGKNFGQLRQRIRDPVEDSYCGCGRNAVSLCDGSSGIFTTVIM